MRSRSLGVIAAVALAGVLAACQPVTPPPPPPPPAPMTLGWNRPGVDGPIAADATHGWLWAMDRGSQDLDAINASNGAFEREYHVSLDGSEHFPTPYVTPDGTWVVTESGTKVVGIDPTKPLPAWTSVALDGIIQSRPLVIESDNIVVVATENDSVYGLNLTTGTIVWGPKSLGTPETQAHVDSFNNVLGDPTSGTLSGCGDIFPLGITSNVVLHPDGFVYAVGEVQTGTTPDADPPDFRMMAVNPPDGTVEVAPVSIVPTSMKTAPVQIAAEQQRAGLITANNNIYIGFGGLSGDCGTYHGYDVVVDKNGSPVGDFESTATTNAGAIWATAGGTVDSSGTVYAATGNNTGNPASGTDYSDGVVAVPSSISGELTTPANYFQPPEWQSDNNVDADLGSSGPVLVANGAQLFEIGKQHNAFLLNTSALGGGDHETPVFRLNGVCSGVSDGQNATLGNSAYFNCSSSGMWQVVIS